jgi:cell division protein FtsX
MQVGRLCRALRAASAFGDALSATLRRLALALMALAGCEVLVQSAQSVVLTYLNPPGQRALTIGVSTDFLLHVVVALLLLALAAVLREAARIAEEHRQFI